MRATGLTAQFEQQRPRLTAVAYRMLGRLSDAEDAVQEAWIRLNRAHARAGAVEVADAGAEVADGADAGEGAVDGADAGDGAVDGADAGEGAVDGADAGAYAGAGADAGGEAVDGADAGAHAGAGAVDNLAAWLTTVVARICLNMLRARHARQDDGLVAQLPDPIVDPVGQSDPEHQALLADSVGLALFVVLETLPPPERLAFVLHDVFALPFDEIAPIVERSAQATRQLASRARRRIQAAHATPDGDLSAQRPVVDAFFAAGRSGDFNRLVAVLHPDVELRGDFGPGRTVSARGAAAVARLAGAYAGLDNDVVPAAVNGAAGAVISRAGRPASIMGFLVVGNTVKAIDVLADPDRIARLDLAAVLERTADWGTETA